MRRQCDRSIPVPSELLSLWHRRVDVCRKILLSKSSTLKLLRRLASALACGLISTLPWTSSRSRSDTDIAASLQIQSIHRSILRFNIDSVVIGRIYLNVESIAAADAEPIRIG